MAHDPEPRDDLARAVEPVREWVAAASGLPVVHDFDEEHDGKGAVLLRPLEFELASATGPVLRHISSAELTLGLLVTTLGLPAFEAAGVTSALALAARTEGEWVMDAAAPSLELWQALQHPPAPAFILRVPVRRLIERPATPLVREPLRTTMVQPRIVVGRVVASDGTPLSAARVAVADVGSIAVSSDSRGRFRLPVSLAPDVPLALRISARGTSVTLALDAPSVDAGGDLGDLTVPVPESSSTR
ncbi:carboxypeptidase-like regulatory domain-containing protein [Microbacterium sp. B2969]|uniref:Carboxypeptidase-like regulatory domain-containing protein n=1 Tax=Microbacterium alkaliflavum TaxID=3248839 RepID=A0ABW7QAJ9_9MICO